MEKVLIIEDNPAVVIALEMLCDAHGISTVSASTPQAGMQQLNNEPNIALVIQDMNFTEDTTSGKEGNDLFYRIRESYPDLPIILLTAWGQLAMAVELVKAGAADYLSKPWDDQRLITTIKNLMELQQLQQDNLRHTQNLLVAQETLANRHDLCGLVYRSEAMQRLLETAVQVAKANVSVLITGPNGSGKEKIAEIIQANSLVKDNAFIKVNAGALPNDLMEAELFGAEVGAFTGANKQRIGRFEAADGGTLFLDEIGNLPLEGQMKLLRVLQTGEFERLGSTETRRTNVRLLSATNANLQQAVSDGHFREDLLYRLNVIELRLPPLAERPEDILPLARFFLSQYTHDSQTEKRLTPDAVRALERYRWPGNVRELQNTLQRAALLTPSEEISRDPLHLPSDQPPPRRLAFEPSKAMIVKALKDHDRNISQVARHLGLSRQALYRRLQKHGINTV